MKEINTERNSNRVTVEFPALPENQMLARAMAAAYMALSDPDVEEMTEVRTAVSEAVSNSIIHGYGLTGCGTITMEMEMTSQDVLSIKVIDKGCGIDDIDKAREPLFSTAADEEQSGMGFTVMESFTDRMTVESELGKGTAVTLIKKLDISGCGQ